MSSKPFTPTLYESLPVPDYFRSLAEQFIEWANEPPATISEPPVWNIEDDGWITLYPDVSR